MLWKLIWLLACRWGQALADHPVGKGHGFRSLVHTAKTKVVLHDASYWTPWELQGSLQQLQDIMATIRSAHQRHCVQGCPLVHLEWGQMSGDHEPHQYDVVCPCSAISDDLRAEPGSAWLPDLFMHYFFTHPAPQNLLITLTVTVNCLIPHCSAAVIHRLCKCCGVKPLSSLDTRRQGSSCTESSSALLRLWGLCS